MRRFLSVLVGLSLLAAVANADVTIVISGTGSTSNTSPSSGEAFTLTGGWHAFRSSPTSPSLVEKN
jgi:hypothetical protein